MNILGTFFFFYDIDIFIFISYILVYFRILYGFNFIYKLLLEWYKQFFFS